MLLIDSGMIGHSKYFVFLTRTVENRWAGAKKVRAPITFRSVSQEAGSLCIDFLFIVSAPRATVLIEVSIMILSFFNSMAYLIVIGQLTPMLFSGFVEPVRSWSQNSCG